MDNQENLEQKLTPKEQKSLFFKFAGMSWSYWFATCFTTYLTIFLQSIGWSTTQVGMMNSINSAVGVVSTPLWGAWSDKIRSVKKVIVILILAGAASYAVIPWVDFRIAGISFLFIIVPLFSFFRAPLNSLIDNWTVRACNKHDMNFGLIRSFGSFSFGIVGLALGYVVTKVNAESESGNLGTVLTFGLYSILLLVLLVFVLSAKDDVSGGKSRLKFRDMHFSRLFKNYHYMTYLIYAVLIQIPMSCVNSFLPYLLAEVNVSSSTYGYITGYKAFIEIPMLLLLKKARTKVPLYYLLFASGLFYMLEAGLYSGAQGFWHIFFIATLQGLGGGLHIAAASNYVYTLAPDDLKATAQTLNGAMLSVAGIFGNLAGGILIDIIGIRTFYLSTCIVIALSLAFYIGSFIFGEKVLKIKKPGLS